MAVGFEASPGDLGEENFSQGNLSQDIIRWL